MLTRPTMLRPFLKQIALNGNIHSLYVSNNNISNQYLGLIIDAAAENSADNIQIIDMSKNKNLTANEIRKILKSFPNLKTLNLSGVLIGNQMTLLAREFGCCQHLKELDLSKNMLGTDNLYDISDLLQSTSITRLSLADNEIHHDGLRLLCHSMKSNTSITHLDVSNNAIPSDGVSFLLPMFQAHPTLASINLSENEIGPRGSQHLAKLISQAPNLMELNLQGNFLRNEGGQTLMSALIKTKTLKKIVLASNGLDVNISAQLRDIGRHKDNLNVIVDSNTSQLSTEQDMGALKDIVKKS